MAREGEALQLLGELSQMSDEEAQQLLDAELWTTPSDLPDPNQHN
jgi:hypothetical protein